MSISCSLSLVSGFLYAKLWKLFCGWYIVCCHPFFRWHGPFLEIVEDDLGIRLMRLHHSMGPSPFLFRWCDLNPRISLLIFTFWRFSFLLFMYVRTLHFDQYLSFSRFHRLSIPTHHLHLFSSFSNGLASSCLRECSWWGTWLLPASIFQGSKPSSA